MSIEFKNNSDVAGIRIELTMINEKYNRPDDWSLENELALMTYMLQVKLMNRTLTGIHGSSKEHWRSNLMNFMNETLDKIKDTGNLQYDFNLFSNPVDLDCVQEFISFGQDRIIAQAVCIDGDEIYTPAYNERCKNEKLKRHAIDIAKQELQAEQEAEREANKIHIVRPIEGYYKHDQ